MRAAALSAGLLLLACAAGAAETTSKALIDQYVREHLASGGFGRLPRAGVVIEDDLDSEFDFFQAHVRGYLKDWDERVYVLKVNKRLYADSPGERGLRGILAHELTHLDEFAHSSTARLAGIGWDYLWSDDNAAVIRWERATDENALRLGHAEGLKDYRRWLYAKLTPERAAKKRRIYYTPEEIDAWTSKKR
jgi:hypothetical protein